MQGHPFRKLSSMHSTIAQQTRSDNEKTLYTVKNECTVPELTSLFPILRSCYASGCKYWLGIVNMHVIIQSYFTRSSSATLLYCHCILVGRKCDRYRIPPNQTNAPISTPKMIKRNKMSANVVERGAIAVLVEDAVSLDCNVVTGAAVTCSSTFGGRADVFVLATVPAVVSCQ